MTYIRTVKEFGQTAEFKLNSQSRQPTNGISGHYTLRKYHESGVLLGEWKFKNRITTLGLNRLGSTDDVDVKYCYVGTGTSPESSAFTRMEAPLPIYASALTGYPSFQSNVGDDHYCRSLSGYRFAAGDAAGNLTEVGIGWSTTPAVSADYLWSRQLIRDSLGNPTVITVLPNEYLDVIYELRLYPDLNVYSGSLSVSGAGTYPTLTRAGNLNSWSVTAQGGLSGRVAVNCEYAYGSTSATAFGLLPSSLTQRDINVTAGSVGSGQFAVTSSLSAYSPNSFKQVSTSGILALNSGNFASGFLGMLLSNFGLSIVPKLLTQSHVILDNARMPKTVNNTLQFVNEIEWAIKSIS